MATSLGDHPDAELRYRSLIESVPQKIIQKDRNSVYLACNANFARDVGIPAEAIVGKTDFDLFPKSLAEKYRADDRRIMESGVTEEIEEAYIKGGQEAWVRTIKAPIRDERGKVSGVTVVFWDTADRRRDKQAHAFLAAIVDSSEDAVIGKSLDGRILSWNRAAETVYGYPAREAIGQSIAILTPPENREDLVRVLEAVRSGGRVEHYETVRVRKDGRRIDVALTISPIRDEAGQVVGASTITRDVTARKGS